MRDYVSAAMCECVLVTHLSITISVTTVSWIFGCEVENIYPNEGLRISSNVLMCASDSFVDNNQCDYSFLGFLVVR